jgi:LysR family hydrogen peroxide-inducible transcriptional activator
MSGSRSFILESGSFETLLQLADEGLGMTLLPYLHTLELSENRKSNLVEFISPPPARQVSVIYHQSELKMQITEVLVKIIQSVVKGAITFQDIKIVSPTREELS